MNDRYVFPPYEFPEEVVPHVDVLRVAISDGGLRELHSTLIILEERYSRHANVGQHETPHPPQKKHLLNNVCKRHVLDLGR